MKLFSTKAMNTKEYLKIVSQIELVVHNRMFFKNETITNIELTEYEFRLIQSNIESIGVDSRTVNWPEYFCGLIVSKE